MREQQINVLGVMRLGVIRDDRSDFRLVFSHVFLPPSFRSRLTVAAMPCALRPISQR
jgi:hypothetical protein